MGTITYLAWLLDKRRPLTLEVAAAIHRFEERCGCAPTEILAPRGSGLTWPGLVVREARTIPIGQVWLGADLDLLLRKLLERAA